MVERNHDQLPKSRDEARKRGLDRFYTGVPCRHGHLAARYVSTTNCVACQVEHARRNGGWQARPSKAAFLEECRQKIEQRRGALLSTEYVAAKKKLKVRCAVGHEFAMTPDNLDHGRWCSECTRQKQARRVAANFRPVEDLRKFALDRHGGDCLAIGPSKMLSKVTWKCSNTKHPPFQAQIAKVIHAGQWCPACWQERREPPKPAVPFNAFIDAVNGRGGAVVKIDGDGIWIGSKTRVLVRCANGHEWSADASNLLYAGSWCPECLNKGERIVRAIFEATFGKAFSKSKPDWLLSPKGRKLELDGYNEPLRLAFEYQGPHHTLDADVIARDKIKRDTCAKIGISLIEVEATKTPHPPQNVLKKVVEAFQRYGIARTPRLPSRDVFAAELTALRDLATERGGLLLSQCYLGGEKHEWKCSVAEHPSWLAEPWRIRRGAWCPSCSGNRRLGIDGLSSWGQAIGLELLDTEYAGGNNANYRWRCHKGAHLISRSRGNILQSISRGLPPCTVCAGTRLRSS
jgi:hypothetical protein